MPDVPATPRPKAAARRRRVQLRQPVHRGEGLLFATGRLALEPDVLGPQFLRTVIFAHYRDLHDLLLDSASRSRRAASCRPAGCS
jgi:hypothetical protein